MEIIGYAFLFFFATLFAWGIEMAVFQRKHLVDSWSVRERVQGRFTGARVPMGRLDDGREVNLEVPALLIILGFVMFCILGLAMLFLP